MIKSGLKYVICLIMIFTLFTPQTICLAQLDTSIGGDSFKRNLLLEDTLGILDGFEEKNEDDAVSRSEMTALIIRALNIAAAKNEGAFPDVNDATAFAEEIQTAYSNGIVVGNDEGNFCPDDNILYYHAIKIAVDAMGYKTLAQMSGGYAKGYLDIAKKFDILKNVSSASEGTIAWKSAVNMIANILTADKPVEESFSGDGGNFVRRDGVTVLTENFGLTKASGVIRTAGIFSSESDFVYNKSTLVVDNIRLNCGFDEPEQYLGLQADVWYDDNDNAKCILIGSRNKLAVISAMNLDSFENNTLTERNKITDKKTRYNIDKGYTYVLNGRLAAADDVNFVYPDGSMTLIDNDGDGKYDFIIAKKAQYMTVGSIDTTSGELYDKNGAKISGTSGVKLSRDNGKWYSIERGGEEIKLNALSAGDILEMYIDSSRELVCANVLSADITGVLEQSDTDTVTIGGTVYYTTEYFKNYINMPSLGTECTAVTDTNGKLVSCTAKKANAMSYGYLVRAIHNEEMNDTLSMKILTEKNTFETYTIADRVTLDGNKVDCTDSSVENALFLNGGTKYQLLRYGINNDGEVSKIDTAKAAPTGTSESGQEYTLSEWLDPDKEDNDKLTCYVDKKLIWYRDGQASPYFTIGQTTVFAVPEALLNGDGAEKRYDEDCFEVTSIDWDNDTRDTYVDAYDYNSAFEPGAVVVYNMASGGQQKKPLADSSSYIVERVQDTSDDDGLTTKSLRLYNGTEFSEALIDADVLGNMNIPSSGDIIRVRKTADGRIVGITIDGKFNKNLKICEPSEDVSTNMMSQVTYVSGTVFTHSKRSIAIHTTTPPGVTVVEAPQNNLYAYKINDSIPVVIYNYDERRARPGTLDDINDSYYAGNNGSKIVIRTRNGDVKNIFLFVGDE